MKLVVIGLASGMALATVWAVGLALPAQAATTPVTDWAGLQAAVAAAQSGDTIVIENDLAATSTMTIPSGLTLTLTSDAATGPYTVLRDPGFAGTMIQEGLSSSNTVTGGTLTITDLTLDGGAAIPGSMIEVANGGLVAVYDNNLVLGTGAVVQNNYWYQAYADGAAVAVSDGSLTMNGDATVTGNTGMASYSGLHSPAVSIADGGTALITDQAVVSGNSGGGVLVSDSSLTVNGNAAITGNDGTSGGGISELSQSTVTLAGNAVVSGNIAQAGGGVYVSGWMDMEGGPAQAEANSYESTLTVTGNAQITGNMVRDNGEPASGGNGIGGGTGGGIAAEDYAFVTVSGHAQVSNNQADGEGGGIGLFAGSGTNDPTLVVGGSSSVDNNTALKSGGIAAVYLANVTIQDDATVSGNTAAGLVGGIGFDQGGVLHVTGNAQVTGNSTTGTWTDTLSAAYGLLPDDPVTGYAVTDSVTGETIAAGGIYMGRLAEDVLYYYENDPADLASWLSVWVGLPTDHAVLIDGNAVVSGNTALTNGGGVALAYGLLPSVQTVQIAGSAALTGNTAPAGNGGGVYVPVLPTAGATTQDMAQYNLLKVGAGVTFAENSASAAYQLAPADEALYHANVLATAFTTPYAVGYNNLDISYTNGALAHIVGYDANGGTGPVPASAAYGVGDTVGVAFSPLPSRTGYVFLGWDPHPGAAAPTYTAGGTTSFTLGSTDVTLYAVWQLAPVPPVPPVATFFVTYDANGGTGAVPVDAKAYAAGATVTVLFSPAPTRPGFAFLGWSTDQTASAAAYAASGTATLAMGSADVTLYAVWQAVPVPPVPPVPPVVNPVVPPVAPVVPPVSPIVTPVVPPVSPVSPVVQPVPTVPGGGTVASDTNVWGVLCGLALLLVGVAGLGLRRRPEM